MGILAAHMYECGYTGVHDGPADVFGTILGESFDPDDAVAGLGGEYRIQQNYFKFHACCRLNHPAIEAAAEIRRKAPLEPEDVTSVEVGLRRHLAGMAGEYPDNTLAAKFSVPYAVATALVRGNAGVGAFSPEALGDDRVRAMAAKVRVWPDADAAGRGDSPTARMWVRLNDGRTLSSSVGIVPGDHGNRLPREEVVEKFRSLTTDILGDRGAAEVTQAVEQLQDIPDVRELTALMGGPGWVPNQTPRRSRAPRSPG
jgi:2-methylcitrate dehydratase PrpD